MNDVMQDDEHMALN